jgi:DNA-binding GntR family transcriptional regulator
MEPLTTTSLRDDAGRVIRTAITGGDLAPGSMYSATWIAERLGISVTPVREAMLDLVRSGLVEPVRNRGFRVVTVAEEDLDEINELRVLLEVPIMHRVVENASEADLDSLQEEVTAIEAAAAVGDVPGLLVADREFHLRLVALSGNARLLALVSVLRDQTQAAGLRTMADGGHLEAAAKEHADILQAVRDRDVERAEAVMRAHLEHTHGIWAGEDRGGAEPA